MPPLRLLVVTARYPTADRPAAGAFVRDRLADPGVAATVVAPRSYAAPGWRRYLDLTWAALVRRGRFDGVEGHFVLPSGVVALLAARLRRLPLIVFAHGSDVREIARRSRIQDWLARRVVRGADLVIANSEETAGAVRALGGQASVVPPGIDLARFTARPRPEHRTVLYLGGSAQSKGVEVARELATTLAGPGIHEIDPADVPALISAHDVVLVPSRAEGFGLVAAEGIASGRWVVAAAVGGLTEVVTDGTNGTLVFDGDFAGALSRVPDYDPDAVAATAARFSREHAWRAARDAWQGVLSGRGQESVVDDDSGTQ